MRDYKRYSQSVLSINNSKMYFYLNMGEVEDGREDVRISFEVYRGSKFKDDPDRNNYLICKYIFVFL